MEGYIIFIPKPERETPPIEAYEFEGNLAELLLAIADIARDSFSLDEVLSIATFNSFYFDKKYFSVFIDVLEKLEEAKKKALFKASAYLNILKREVRNFMMISGDRRCSSMSNKYLTQILTMTSFEKGYEKRNIHVWNEAQDGFIIKIYDDYRVEIQYKKKNCPSYREECFRSLTLTTEDFLRQFEAVETLEELREAVRSLVKACKE